MQEKTLQEWTKLNTKPGPKIPLFNVEISNYQNPRNGTEVEALILHARPTTNVLCLTSEQKIVLVEQFRFGTARFHCELPAGIVDRGESELQAAQRELLEETGYTSDAWVSLGVSFINPSYVDNTCHHYLAYNAVKKQSPKPEASEDLAVKLVSRERFDELIRQGIICDAMSRVAWGLWKNEAHRRL